MSALVCPVCGERREAKASDLYAVGPPDLCAKHYAEWFRQHYPPKKP